MKRADSAEYNPTCWRGDSPSFHLLFSSFLASPIRCSLLRSSRSAPVRCAAPRRGNPADTICAGRWRGCSHTAYPPTSDGVVEREAGLLLYCCRSERSTPTFTGIRRKLGAAGGESQDGFTTALRERVADRCFDVSLSTQFKHASLCHLREVCLQCLKHFFAWSRNDDSDS